MASHDHHAHRILSEIAGNDRVSQRSLANNLGIALGLTNLLLRRIAHKGWIRIVRVRPNRVRYLLTPAGIAEKARMSREALQRSVRFYAEARARIRESFADLSAQLDARGNGNGRKRILFYGAGEVAEIGYVCLQETDLHLAGVVDPLRTSPFFGIPVTHPSSLCAAAQETECDAIVVMSFDENVPQIGEQLEQQGIPAMHIFWI